jgi:hypothetical protein
LDIFRFRFLETFLEFAFSLAIDLSHLPIHRRRRWRRDLVDSIAGGKGGGRSQEKGGGSGSEFHLDNFFGRMLIQCKFSMCRLSRKGGKSSVGKRFDDGERCVALLRRKEGAFSRGSKKSKERKLQ